MPTNAAIAILFADGGPMPGGVVPVCLEKVLGDPILLWQLRALPEEIGRAHVIAGGDHFEAIAKLVAAHNAEAGGRAECHQSQGVPRAVLGLAKTGAAGPGSRALLLPANRPLIGGDTIKALLGCGCNATPDRHSQEAVLLDWPMVEDAAERLALQNPGADSKCLLSAALHEITLMVVGCGREERLRAETRRDLAKIQGAARKRVVSRWLDAGVAFIDARSVHIGPRVVLAAEGVTIEPQVRMEGRVVVGEGTTVGQGSIVRDSVLGANIDIRPYCSICGAEVGDGARVGPFANLREGSRVGPDVHLGNFVETKNARLHPGAKANHLTYLGDCEVGENTNIGAGCITCNYDGFSKHRTVIGKDVFIGSDCQLVAPVTVGDGALLAAGTTLTSDAPKDALVLTRPETTMKEGGARKLRAILRKNAASEQ